MRLDKYLKVSRIIKRRTVANDACDAGRVTVNGKVAKAGTEVKIGDVIEIKFGNNTTKVEVLAISETQKKEEAASMYKSFACNGVQREHNKKFNNGLPILHKVPPKRDYGRYFCIMAEKGGTSHGGLTEKLSLFFHAKKQEVNAYGR